MIQEGAFMQEAEQRIAVLGSVTAFAPKTLACY